MPEVIAKPQPAPPGLGSAGRSLWRSIARRWRLDEREHMLLSQAAKTSDLIADLEALLQDQGLVIAGSNGQPRLSPIPAEIRAQRLALEKMLAALSLPVPDEEAPRVSRTQQLRSQRRWGA